MSGAGKWESWIGWNGGECPVEDVAIIEIATRFGVSKMRGSVMLDWSIEGNEDPIVAYRVQIQPDVETVTLYGDGRAWNWSKSKATRDTHRLTYTMTDGVIDCGSEKMMPL